MVFGKVLSFRASTIIAVCAILATGQQPAKRALTLKDADAWRSITNQILSNDGKLLAYAVFPQEGDGELILREIATGREKHESLGALPPPPDPNAEVPEEQPGRTPGVRIVFTPDERYVVSTAFPAKADTDQARKEHKRSDQMPKGGLVILPVGDGTALRIANVKSVQVPQKGDSFAVYLKESAPSAAAEVPEAKQPTDQARGAGSRAGAGPRPQFGSDLVIRGLGTAGAAERTFADVTEYALSKDGKTLVYTVGSKKEETNGVFTVSPLDPGAPAALLAGKGKYAKPTWDRAQNQLAFLAAPDDPASKVARFRLYLWDRKSEKPAELVGATAAGFRDGYVLYDRGTVNFSRDGSRVFVGVASEATAARAPETPAGRQATASVPGDDKVVADLWRSNDDYVQPMQKVRAAQERTRSYRGVFHLAEKRFVQLGDPAMAGLIPSDDGRYAIGTDDRQYRAMVDYDGNFANYFLVDTLTGERKLMVEKFRSGAGPGGPAVDWSPDGKHVLLFRGDHWHTISIPGGVDTNLTGKLGVKFSNEDHDTPGPAPAYGNGGWTRDGRVLVYDRYDVWAISADGQTAQNLTAGTGRRENLQFRVIRLDRPDPDEQERGLDPSKPVLLRAENLETRDTGMFEAHIGREQAPRKLLMGPRSYHPLLKARDADVVLITATTFTDEPDLQVTDSRFSELRKVSHINPQKTGILWGTGELLRYKTTDGISLQAALYKPENFDPSKKYPMMVYLYERLSQNLHVFIPPRPGTSINISEYVSNGYLVLTPDIAYTIGAPGPSALKCVLPAVQAVVDRGYVDEKAIGIQGHSWGGYQVAYMVTQTNRFRAAEAGAPVADMISAYNGIRWGTGLPRQFQYEQTQSRIGGTPWQYPLRFIENSPVFHVDRVETPLLILHDDGDDAVPWYQGIELFLSLRRLGKEAYFFDYNGEAHGLRKRPNQKDYSARMRQFFDHYLKGAPAPEWMEKGIPYIDREAEKERFRTATDR